MLLKVVVVLSVFPFLHVFSLCDVLFLESFLVSRDRFEIDLVVVACFCASFLF